MGDYDESTYTLDRVVDSRGNPVLDPVTGLQVTVYESTVVRNPSNWTDVKGKGHECCVCGTVYPDAQMLRKGPKYYCFARGCNKDLE